MLKPPMAPLFGTCRSCLMSRLSVSTAALLIRGVKKKPKQTKRKGKKKKKRNLKKKERIKKETNQTKLSAKQNKI